MKTSPILVALLLSACGTTTLQSPVFDIKPVAPNTTNDLTLEFAQDPSLDYTVNWLQDGTGRADFSGGNTLTIPAEETSRGEVWSAVVVTTRNNLYSEPVRVSVTIGNSAPEKPVLSFTPSAPTSSQSLRIHATAEDSDGDAVSFSYQWFKDDNPQPEFTEASVDASATRSGETWEAVVIASDGVFSSEAASLDTTIDNTPPEIYSVNFINESPGTSDDLQVSIDGLDPDGDETHANFKFTVGSNIYDNGDSATFSSENFVRGDTVTVEVTLYDGFNAASDPASAEISIGNTLPTLTGAEVTSLSTSGASVLRTDSVATCTPVGWDDPDQDSESIEVTWLVNGQPVATQGQTLSGVTEFDRDDQVACIATPIDSFGAGEPAQSSAAVVQNSPPTFSGVELEVDNASSLGPLEANEDSTVTVAFTDLHDADGDEVQTRVVWYIRGNSYGPGNPIWDYAWVNNGAEICGEEYVRGDQIKAESWPHDGIDEGELNSSAATSFSDWWTVVNTPPVVQMFYLGQSDYQLNDTINVLLTAYDADEDTLVESYTWKVNNTVVNNPNNRFSTPAELQAVKGDNIEVTVQLDDQYGGVSAEALSGAAVVADTPPQVSNISLSASLMDENGSGTRASPLSTLTCSFSIEDVDTADLLSWRVDWIHYRSDQSSSVFANQTGIYPSEDTASLDLSTVTTPFDRDETIACSLTPSGDGFSGTPSYAGIVVGNSPPVVENLSFSPSTPTTNDTLTLQYDATDPNNDFLVDEITWYVENTQVAVNTLTLEGPTFFDKDEEVMVTVSSSDGTDSSSVESLTVTVANSAPEGLVAIVKPESPVESRDPIVCEVQTEAIDPDVGDTVEYTVSWQVDATPDDGQQNFLPYTGTTHTTTLTDDTIVAAALVVDYVYLCTLTPQDNDGLAGTPSTAETTIVPDPCASGAQSFNSAAGAYIEIGDSNGDGIIDETGTLGNWSGSGTDDFTVEAWVYPASPGATAAQPDRYFIGAVGTAAYLAESWEIGFRYGNFYGTTGSAITASFYQQNGQSTTLYSLEEADQPTHGYWHHVAVTRELTNNRFKYRMYVDGLHVDTVTENNASNATLATMTGPIHIGQSGTHPNGNTEYDWNGYIDEVRISDAALYTTQSFELEPRLAVTQDTLALYRFDSDTGTTAIDAAAGMYGDGQVGPANQSAASFWPDSVCDASGDIVHIDAGANHTCWIDSAGNIDCWGLNGYNQVSPRPSGTFIDISAGEHHSCALTSNGCIRCWGLYGTNADSLAVGEPASCSWENISAGADHTCVRDSSGTVECWGQDNLDQHNVPNTPLSQVETKENGTCAIRETNGQVACWGGGAGTATLLGSIPVGNFQDLAVGHGHACAVKTNGILECWGSDTNSWNRVNGAPYMSNAHSVGVSWFASCAIDTDQALQCWGHAGDGKTSPPTGQYESTVGGYGHHCALTTLGRVRCWGDNSNGNQTSVPSH